MTFTYRSLTYATVALLAAVWLASPLHADVGISISPRGGFDITPGLPVVDQEIASITVDANQSYSVRLLDSNDGKLRSGFHEIPYRVRYENGSEITLSQNPIEVEFGSSATAATRRLTVFIDAGVSLGIPAGDYSDTITVEIVAE